MNTCAKLCAAILLAIAAPLVAAGDPPPTPTARPRVQPVQPVQPVQVPVRPAQQAPPMQTGVAVDAVAVLKNQLHQCELERTQLDQENDGLRQQAQSLQQVQQLQQQKAALQRQLDETVHPGGSLVKAYCEDATTSRNTAGAISDCGVYACEPVSGLCRTRCNAAVECRQGYVCDTPSGQCVQ